MILFLSFLFRFSFDREDNIKYSRQCLATLPDTSKVVRDNTPLRVIFSTLSRVLGVWKYMYGQQGLSCLI